MSVYVGYGYKYEQKTYYPINPPAIMDDPEEFEEQPEPTPLEEPAPEAKEGEGEGEEAEGEGGEEG